MKTKAEMEAIRLALAQIADENGGQLTPDAVVAEAASKSSPLHDLFEWDGKKAAHDWRLAQARALIRSVRVIITTDKTSVSVVAYVRDPEAPADEQGYCATASLIGETDRARAALVNEFSRAASALRRARELAIAFGMDGEVEAVTASIETMRTRVESSVSQHLSA